MSDLFNNLTAYSNHIVPFVFLGYGVVSSLHCVGMCGGLALLAHRNKSSSWLYQIGRLIGYLGVGVTISFVGKKAIAPLMALYQSYSWMFLIFLLSMITLYFIFSKFLNSHIPLYIKKIISEKKSNNLQGFLIGINSVLLPCGLLHLMLIAAAGLTAPVLAAISIIMFWLGTLPAMQFGVIGLRSLLKGRLKYSSQVLTVVAIMLSYSILAKRMPQAIEITDIKTHQCH